MGAPDKTQPAQRFAGIFSAGMVFCVLVWMWGLGLYLVWPWQQGGEWLPDFPIVAVCADETVCAVPYGQLAEARAAGKIKSLLPPGESGETAYEAITLHWKRLPGGMESKASAWNFQTTVRYRVDDELPVLVSYQEISGKIFLIALGGALLSLLFLYRNKLKPRR